MSAAAIEPIPLHSLQRSVRPISWLVSRLAAGLERVPRTGSVLFAGRRTIHGGLDIFALGLSASEGTGRYLVEVLVDATDLMDSPVGALLRRLGIIEKRWFRRGEVIPSIWRGRGPAGPVRAERHHFHFGEPIDTMRFDGLHEDRAACLEFRKDVQRELELGLAP